MIASKIDWIIEILANGVYCAKCGKVENHYPMYICNAHTHGMDKYGHPDFQLVINLHPNQMGYVLNNLGLRVQAGEQFKAGDLVEGIFERCPLRLDEVEESGRMLFLLVSAILFMIGFFRDRRNN